MKEDSLKPVYYLYGAEDYLMEEEFLRIKSIALQGPFASMNYQSFEGKGADPSEITSAASTMPAFADFRLVVIKGAEAMKDNQLEGLIDYIKRPSPSTCFVFISGATKIDKGSSFFKALAEGGYLKAYSRLYEEEVRAWIKKEAKRQGKTIADGAVRALAEIAGTKLRDVKAELDKIVLFVGDKASIEEKDVEESGLDCREETIFALSDAIGSKDIKKAFKVYGKIEDEEPLKVLGSISRQIRTLLKIKALLRKGVSPQKLPSMLGLFPKHAEEHLRRSRKFSEEELKRAIGRLCIADADLKSSRAPASTVLPRLIIELCGGR